MIVLFDNIGAYIVDLFYNDLYLKAKASVERGDTDYILDTYKSFIRRYVEGLIHPRLITNLLNSIYGYYQHHAFYTQSMSDFETLVVAQCVPMEMMPAARTDRNVHLRDLLVRAIGLFSKRIMEQQFMEMIVDDHQNAKNINVLQDLILQSLITIREDIYEKHLNHQEETVSIKLLDRANAKLTRLDDKVRVLETDLNSAIKIIETQRYSLQEKDATLQKLLGTIKLLNSSLREARTGSKNPSPQYSSAAQFIARPAITSRNEQMARSTRPPANAPAVFSSSAVRGSTTPPSPQALSRAKQAARAFIEDQEEENFFSELDQASAQPLARLPAQPLTQPLARLPAQPSAQPPAQSYVPVIAPQSVTTLSSTDYDEFDTLFNPADTPDETNNELSAELSAKQLEELSAESLIESSTGVTLPLALSTPTPNETRRPRKIAAKQHDTYDDVFGTSTAD